MRELRTIPILGTKTDVPPDDPSMLRMVGEGVYLTHDAGGVNFDTGRRKNVCSKSLGKAKYSNSANASATNCQGIFYLDDGTNVNRIIIDNGDVYYYDGSFDPVEIEDGGSTAFNSANIDLFSMIQVGEYFVFADRGGHTPYKWKHGDANLTKLCASGTEYKFRYLESFQRRVIGCYSDQTNGDIDIRWSTPWPTTAITSLNFPAANQFYVPNDDSIVGVSTMGQDRCYVYCENSIQQISYYPDYSTPFKIYTVVPRNGGTASNSSIVSLGDRHFLYHTDYGFCEYRGGSIFPYGGKPISANIENEVAGIDIDYSNLIVGAFVPFDREVVWCVPRHASVVPNSLMFYNIDTKQWRIEDKAMRYVNVMKLRGSTTWNDLSQAITIWGNTTDYWSAFAGASKKLTYGNIDGHLYYQSGETDNSSDYDGYRVEPVMDFGKPYHRKMLKEIWFGLVTSGDFSIDIYHRSADTSGAILLKPWTALSSLSCNNPSDPRVVLEENARFHQIKWGCDAKDERFQVNHITYRWEPGVEY